MKKLFTLLTLFLALSAWGEIAVFDFHNNALSMFEGITVASTSNTNGGDFTVAKSTTVNGVVLTVTPSDGNTPNRIWNDYNLGLQLRVYGGTFSFTAPEGEMINAISFDTSVWNDPTADNGTVSENFWKGKANKVTFAVDGQIRINTITVAYGESTIEPEPTLAALWKVWYFGEDDEVYTIEDDLYVDHVDPDGLIYVTDNATTILFDIYADLGYVWEMDWTPDWIAIDCGDDSQLAQAIQAMSIIKGGTLTGILQDNYTNPRLVVKNVPEVGEGEKPQIAYRDLDITTDSISGNGREVLYISGIYNNFKLEGTIESENGSILQSVDFIREDDTDLWIPDGVKLHAKAYLIQKEPWETAGQGTMHRMPSNDPKWYTNLEIHAFEFEYSQTGVTDVDAAQTVKEVKYVNAMGQTGDSPFDGINIVVTRYDNGSVNTRKAAY